MNKRSFFRRQDDQNPNREPQTDDYQSNNTTPSMNNDRGDEPQNDDRRSSPYPERPAYRRSALSGRDSRVGSRPRQYNSAYQGAQKTHFSTERTSTTDGGGNKYSAEKKNTRYGERNEIPKEAPENVIFGIHPVREALEMGQAVEKIYFKRSSENDDQRYSKYGSSTTGSNEALESIRELARRNNIVCQEVPAEKLDRLTRRNNHQGVVAVVPAIEYADFNEIVEKFAEANIPPLIVVLDGVTDVRNFGAIARSAECAGADAIIISAKNSAPVNAESLKSSAGALSVIPVCKVGSVRNAVKTLQMNGLKLVAATEKSDKIVFQADFTGPLAIIMGAEDHGISIDILRMCDERIAIPLLGKIESLNVSAAASVLLFEAVRQRFNSVE